MRGGTTPLTLHLQVIVSHPDVDDVGDVVGMRVPFSGYDKRWKSVEREARPAGRVPMCSPQASQYSA